MSKKSINRIHYSIQKKDEQILHKKRQTKEQDKDFLYWQTQRNR